MPTITAKDLTREVPRSPYEEVGGFPWLGRLIDKARAMQAGTLGEYIPYPCGGDQRFLQAVGVDPEALKPVLLAGASDEQIVAWLREHAAPGYEERLQDYRRNQRGPIAPERIAILEEAKAELARQRPGVDLSQVDNMSKLICVEEGHPLP